MCYTSISRLSLALSLVRSLSHGSETPLLLFFEWGPSFISASRVSPSESLAYGVTKTPFLWMSLSEDGDVVTFLDPDAKPGVEREIQSKLVVVERNTDFPPPLYHLFLRIPRVSPLDGPYSNPTPLSSPGREGVASRQVPSFGFEARKYQCLKIEVLLARSQNRVLSDPWILKYSDFHILPYGLGPI
ncbi:hypothetical protein DEO72_LG8g1277 [Vigna unguiculata]|uniref:Uncharacterized protein n=1 Tax=Vigna unguiculata TaxID=3917 RepID=A0A4D6MPF8_VIGUN|nr:hypothetical protein DEO72_LG8g1277 [Vigna unguiculata]